MRLPLTILSLFIFISAFSQNPDIDILRSLNTKDPSEFWVQTTNSAYWMPAVLAVGSIAYAFANKSKTSKLNAYETSFSIGIGLSLSTVIKLIVNRPRPGDQYPDIVFPYHIVHGHSFPSGHTTSAFLLATTLLFQYQRWYVAAPAFLWAGAVGYSRMKLGEHFPTDVLGGIVVGGAGALLSHLAVQKWIK